MNRLGAFGGQMALASIGAFAPYGPIPTWPGSPLWGPSGQAFAGVAGFGDAFDFGAASGMMSDQKFQAWLRTAKPAALRKHLQQLQKAAHSGGRGHKGKKGKKGGHPNLKKIHHRIQLIRQRLQQLGKSKGRGQAMKRRRMPLRVPRMSQMPQRPEMRAMMQMPGNVPDAYVADDVAAMDSSAADPYEYNADGLEESSMDSSAGEDLVDSALDGFGSIGDLVVGGATGLGDLMVGAAEGAADFAGLGGFLEPVTDWWNGQSYTAKAVTVGALLLGFYMYSTGGVRLFDTRGSRRVLYATNPRRHRPWSGAYGKSYQARYKSKSYRSRHNRRRSRR